MSVVPDVRALLRWLHVLPRRLLQHANSRSPRLSRGISGTQRLFDFGDQRRADDGSVGDAAQHATCAGQRNAEADGNRQRRELPHAPHQSGQFLGQRFARRR